MLITSSYYSFHLYRLCYYYNFSFCKLTTNIIIIILKLGKGLVYEAVEDTYFPHFYGPDRSFQPLPLDTVSKVEKLLILDGEFSCSLLD